MAAPAPMEPATGLACRRYSPGGYCSQPDQSFWCGRCYYLGQQTMSDLPSRERINHWIDDNHDREYSAWLHGLPGRVVAAYSSGRLVDGEAIDYKAADEELRTWAGQVEGLTSSTDAVRAIVAAAIGDTDDAG